MARSSARLSFAVTTPMCRVVPAITSENRTRSGPIQLRPAAFTMRRVGGPPRTGTVQVSKLPAAMDKPVYAMREASGVNTGSYLMFESKLSCFDSPSGSSFT